MKVFISWSGAESKQVALVLREWLPSVIQLLDTWVSEADIDKGESWITGIKTGLVEAGGSGVFCLTQNNLESPWMAFEAGALAMHDRGRVAPFLHGVTAAELKYPLALFQATVGSSRDDVYRLIDGLNKRTSHPLTESRLKKSFDANWPTLEQDLARIQAPKQTVATLDEGSEQLDLLRDIQAAVRRIEKDYAVRTPNLGFGQGGLLDLFAENPAHQPGSRALSTFLNSGNPNPAGLEAALLFKQALDQKAAADSPGPGVIGQRADVVEKKSGTKKSQE